MPGMLDGRRIAFLFTHGVEQVELTQPLDAVRAEGAEVDLVSLEVGAVQAFWHLDRADTFQAGRIARETPARDYDGLVLPGGVANPDALRLDEGAVRLVRAFFEQGKPVGAICHAPWVLVEADVLRGRTLTSFPSLRTDIRNAGGRWVDQEVVVDGGLVTSRRPDDLPAFCAKLLEELREGVHTEQARSLARSAS